MEYFELRKIILDLEKKKIDLDKIIVTIYKYIVTIYKKFINGFCGLIPWKSNLFVNFINPLI